MYEGTPVLYETFKTAELLLIDPLRGVEARVKKLLRDRPFTFIEAAVGAVHGTASLSSDGQYSSLSIRSDRPKMEALEVPVVPLDSVVEKLKPRAPYGLKIDTEGHDLDVIRGAQTTISKSEFVLVETSLRRRFAGSYLFSDVVLAMRDLGLEVADAITPAHHNRFADVLFVRRDHPSLEVRAVQVTRF